MNCPLCRYRESNCHNCHKTYQTLRLKKFPIADDGLNLRLKLSILSWLQLLVIRTISRKTKACTRRCCLLPKIRESIKVYRDAAGLCKIATLDEIEAQGWSLNPGRYVGVAQRQEAEDFDESRTVGRVEWGVVHS